MIWESTFLMAVFDVLIISATCASVWMFAANRKVFVRAGITLGASMMIVGLATISMFYLTDLVAMFVLPWFTSTATALAVMEQAHLNYSWIYFLTATVFISAGFAIGTHKLLPLANRLQVTQFAVDHASDCVYWMTSDARFFYVNDSACKILGYAREDLLSMSLRDIDPDFAAEAWHGLWKRVRDCESLTAKGHYRNKQGHVFPVEIKANLIQFEGQEIYCSVVRDVTERTRATETLRQAHRDLAATNARLEVEIGERKRAEHSLQVKAAQLIAITDSMFVFLESGNWREASSVLLHEALVQTESVYGFIGVVGAGPVLRILAHEGLVWDSTINREFYEEALRTYQEDGYLEFKDFQNLFGAVITDGKPVIANEPGKDPRSGGIPPGHPPLHAFLGVPIFREREVVGLIGVANRSGGYSGHEQDQIQILSRAAGVLYDSYRRMEREAKLEAERKLAEEAMREMNVALANAMPGISRLDPVGHYEIVNDIYAQLLGYDPGMLVGMDWKVTVHRDDWNLAMAAYHRMLQDGKAEFEATAMRKDGSTFAKQVLMVRRLDKEGKFLGHHCFTRDITERKQAEATQHLLLSKVISAQEEERRRVARELHDEAGQSLTSLLLGLQLLNELNSLAEVRSQAKSLRKIVDSTLSEIQRLARGLRPSVLDDQGLEAAIRRYVGEFSLANPIEAKVIAERVEKHLLPPAAETALYRIVQEALTNASKHSGASRVSVLLKRGPSHVRVIVEDNGKGFDVRRVLEGQGDKRGLGLLGMRERVALLNGAFSIESSRENGTAIYADVPLVGN